MTDQNSTSEVGITQRQVVFIFSGVLVLWGVSWLLLFFDEGARGTFGDMFGAVNALFSGLAFAGLIVTLWMQREELSLQREELKATREELRRSAIAQELSEASLRKQAEAVEASAKLATVTALLAYYDERIAWVQKIFEHAREKGQDTFTDEYRAYGGYRNELLGNRAKCIKILNEEFGKLTQASSEKTSEIPSDPPPTPSQSQEAAPLEQNPDAE